MGSLTLCIRLSDVVVKGGGDGQFGVLCNRKPIRVMKSLYSYIHILSGTQPLAQVFPSLQTHEDWESLFERNPGVFSCSHRSRLVKCKYIILSLCLQVSHLLQGFWLVSQSV